MLDQNFNQRPDRQLEKMLIFLVYAIVAMILSLLLLFVYPQYSLYLMIATLLFSVLSIGLTISLMSGSEQALTYGGFANEILNSRTVINRIDNNQGFPVIENGLSQKFFNNRNVLQTISEMLLDDRQNALNFQRLELALKGLKKESVELQLQTTNGEEWYNVTLKPLYLKQSDIFEEDFSIEKVRQETYFFWTMENITAAKNMDKIFEEERKKLHNFINLMPIGLYIVDANYNIEYVNDTFAQQIGEEKEQLSGKNLGDLLVEKNKLLNPQQPTQTVQAVFQNNAEKNTELFVMQNAFNDAGEIKIRGLTVKELPTEKQLTENLHDAIDELDWLFNLSPHGIVFIDGKGIVQRINAKGCEILDVDKTQLSGKAVSAFWQSPQADVFANLYRQYAADFTKRDIVEIESAVKADKTIRIFAAPRWRIHHQQNKLDGLALYLTDTTEQKNLELRFAQAQKMQAMGQLAGGVAHDFNNLLTAMIGFCDLLLQRHGIGDPSYADLIQIRQNANRAAGLVRQLLAFSRKQPLNPKRIDVTENFIELNHLLKRILGEQISLEFKHGSDLGFIRVDPVQFSQVIINLAVNAKDAMNGKGNLKISTKTEVLAKPYQFGADTIAPGEFVVISVADNGCGIPQENLNRIFEPFFSTKQNVVGSGTGLGLAMVYGIVRQTEGFIKVESKLGQGTIFSIHLPRFADSEDNKRPVATPKPQTTPMLTSASENQAPKIIVGLNVSTLDHNREQPRNPQEIKVLFVEDEDSVRIFGVRALKKKGFAVTACNCAESALECLHKGEKFDLLVTDMVMPGLSGAELAKESKKYLPDIKIILASGYSEEIARQELAGSEEFSFIAKPYSLGDLTQKVFNILNNGQS